MKQPRLSGVMYARRLSCRQWYAGYEKTLCHDIHSHDTESGQGSAPHLISTLALPSCFTLGQKLERVSAALHSLNQHPASALDVQPALWFGIQPPAL